MIYLYIYNYKDYFIIERRFELEGVVFVDGNFADRLILVERRGSNITTAFGAWLGRVPLLGILF